MPTYEYECQKCKKTFEVFQSMTDVPLKKCKFCSGAVNRLIGTGGGIIFKGSGFYSTDYRKRDYKEKEKREKPPSCPSCPSQGPACKGCPKAE
jgi:putative FmdB family regulatory protein